MTSRNENFVLKKKEKRKSKSEEIEITTNTVMKFSRPLTTQIGKKRIH